MKKNKLYEWICREKKAKKEEERATWTTKRQINVDECQSRLYIKPPRQQTNDTIADV